MAGKLSPGAQVQLALYEGFAAQVGRIHSLVEQFAVAKVGHEGIIQSLKRAAGQTKLRFMTAGLESLSQICGSIELAAGRGGPPSIKVRTLRELVGTLKFQIELGIRTIMREDAELQDKLKKKKEAQKQASSEM